METHSYEPPTEHEATPIPFSALSGTLARTFENAQLAAHDVVSATITAEGTVARQLAAQTFPPTPAGELAVVLEREVNQLLAVYEDAAASLSNQPQRVRITLVTATGQSLPEILVRP